MRESETITFWNVKDLADFIAEITKQQIAWTCHTGEGCYIVSVTGY